MKKVFSTLAAAAAAALLLGGGATAQDKIKIGYAVSKTGPNAPGAGITTIPNYQLWIHDINEAGGIKLGETVVPIEVIEYDDQSNTEELVRAVERLVNQDEVDILLTPWGTGMNLAVGPTFNKYGYPQMAATAATDRAYEMGERWPNSFWMLGTSTMGAKSLAEVLTKLHDAGKINEKVAMVSVADAFGIELAAAARPVLDEAGFELVMDESYPITTQDFSQLISSAKDSGADTFVAFSYPPDTFGLTGAAIAGEYNPAAFYTAVGTAFPIYKDQLFHDNVDGVLGIGGVNTDDPKFQDYRKRHVAVTGQEPDRWASPVTYASLEVLQQAIERVGKIDREAIIKEIQTGTFDTVIGEVKLDRNVNTNVWWAGQWQNGDFHGLAPAGMEGAKEPVAPKPAWKPAG
ncbi:MAG: amino acid ABC transporter substrate-binding protein [Bauldia sp.]|uniref:amino acid ABC transporter substrate-binding protein n=1 Tax=Bauldia sp. TaxID=2575872 RepID=UPI001DDF3171|nr:amino acid ABC transporter substrate-binding protein [Bauldia sp.]MCB1497125.1 amino acid ABC transporter substrate-binding protein [Bauldia sp.]